MTGKCYEVKLGGGVPRVSVAPWVNYMGIILIIIVDPHRVAQTI